MTYHDDSLIMDGRSTPPSLVLLMFLSAMGSLLIGLMLLVGHRHTDLLFAWEFASPVSAALVGAGFVGAVWLLMSASGRPHWEEARIAGLPSGILIVGMLTLLVTNAGSTRLTGGPIVALATAWILTLAMAALALWWLVAMVAVAREPALPLARVHPMPRWVLPPLALLASGFLGLGVALLAEPAWWGRLVPWAVTALDARALGVWCLVLGLALLQSLVEDDLERVQAGLPGLTLMGVLGLASLAMLRGEVDWSGWPALCLLVLLGGLTLTGGIGIALHRRMRSSAFVPA